MPRLQTARRWQFLCLLWAGVFAAGAAEQVRTGRVLVVANSLSPGSLELASQYRHSRNLPPLNLLTVTTPIATTIDPAQFQETILKPLRQRLKLLDAEAIDAVVLCRDVPYRVGTVSATTAIMFDGEANIRPAHGYFRQECAFDASIPFHGEKRRLATVLSGYSAADALALLDNSRVRYAAARDAGRVYFCDGAGPRGVRNAQIPAAIAMLATAGVRCDHVPEAQVRGREDILVLCTGAETVQLAGNRFVPGALADNLTSFGGCLLDPAGQTSILAFIQYGACGAYGTLSEPTNDLKRWADYTLPARYLAGATLGEAYLQTVRDWRFGVVVGDPLAAPFAGVSTITFELPHGGVVSGANPTTRVQADMADIAVAEVWLNDQERIHCWQPVVAAGSTVRLSVKASDGRAVYEHKLAVAAATPWREIFAQLAAAQDLPEGAALQVVGRHRNRLLLRWPTPNAEPPPLLTASLERLWNGDQATSQEATHPLIPAATPDLMDNCLETVLTATDRYPAPGPDIAIPLEHCSAGWNRLLFRAEQGRTAAATEVKTGFTVKRPGAEVSVLLTTPVVSLHTDLVVNLATGPALRTASPELCIDGRVMCQWEAGATRGMYRINIPLVAPGPHEVWVQWAADPGLRSPLVPYVPLARSEPQVLFVRRPLTAGTNFSPRDVTAGQPVTLEFSGPYLRDGLSVVLAGKPVNLTRNPQNGQLWVASIGALVAGPCRVDLVGDPETESPGSLPELLMVKPAAATTP